MREGYLRVFDVREPVPPAQNITVANVAVWRKPTCS